jgi:SNF2 family DNA or RNA helicase
VTGVMKLYYGAIELKHGNWELECEPDARIVLLRLFAKVSKYEQGPVKIADTIENCRDIAWFMVRFPLHIAEGNKMRLAKRSLEHKDEEIAVANLIDGHVAPEQFEMAIPLREYQAVGASLAYRSRGCLIADVVGLGKTLQGIALLTKPDTLPAVVCVPTHLTRQWQDEIHRFAPSLRTHVLKKGTPYEIKSSLFGAPDVIITNYHKIKGWARTLAGAKTLILDEAQECRRRDSDKYRALETVAARARRVLALSATPIHNYGVEEYFNVFHIIKPGALGKRDEFQRGWGHGDAYGGKATIKNPKAFGAWLRKRGLMIRRTRADVGRELPALTKVRQLVDADLSALDSLSDSCAELARIILGDTQVYKGEKMNAAGQLDMALRQATGIAKAVYVAEFVRMILESGEKVLLVGWHRAVYDIWLDKLKEFKPVLFTGTETASQKEASKRAFIEGDSQVLIMSLRSGIGLDGLQKVCRIIVIGELDWAPPVHDQAIGRLQRDGTDGGVMAYFMVSEAGSDPVVEDALGLKRADQIPVLDPDAPIVEEKQDTSEHIRKLAESYLIRKGELPAPVEVEKPDPVMEAEWQRFYAEEATRLIQ